MVFASVNAGESDGTRRGEPVGIRGNDLGGAIGINKFNLSDQFRRPEGTGEFGVARADRNIEHAVTKHDAEGVVTGEQISGDVECVI